MCFQAADDDLQRIVRFADTTRRRQGHGVGQHIGQDIVRRVHDRSVFRLQKHSAFRGADPGKLQIAVGLGQVDVRPGGGGNVRRGGGGDGASGFHVYGHRGLRRADGCPGVQGDGETNDIGDAGRGAVDDPLPALKGNVAAGGIFPTYNGHGTNQGQVALGGLQYDRSAAYSRSYVGGHDHGVAGADDDGAGINRTHPGALNGQLAFVVQYDGAVGGVCFQRTDTGVERVFCGAGLVPHVQGQAAGLDVVAFGNAADDAVPGAQADLRR